MTQSCPLGTFPYVQDEKMGKRQFSVFDEIDKEECVGITKS